MFQRALGGLAAVAIVSVGAAHAAPVVEITDPTTKATFTSFSMGGAGTQGAELRGGDGAGNATWEAGIGVQTSQNGTFVQANYGWTETADGQDFRFEVNSAGEGYLTIAGTAVDLAWTGAAMQLGNAFEIFANRGAEMTITAVNGMAYNFNIGDITDATTGEEKVFYSEDFLNGLVIEGTLGLINGRNSANLIFIKPGNIDVSPIPVPAAGLLFAGAAGMGALRRFRKS